MRLLRVFVPASMIVAAACSDSTAPKRLSAIYDLSSIDGRTVPDVDTLITGTLIVTTAWGTLSLSPDGSAIKRTHKLRIDVGIDSIESTDSATFTYRIKGDSIELTPTVHPCGFCSPGWHGTISSSSLAISDELFPEASPVYLYSEGILIVGGSRRAQEAGAKSVSH